VLFIIYNEYVERVVIEWRPKFAIIAKKERRAGYTFVSFVC